MINLSPHNYFLSKKFCELLKNTLSFCFNLLQKQTFKINVKPGKVLTKKPYNLEARTPYVCHFIIHSQLIPSFDSAERLKIPPNFCIPMYYFMEVSIETSMTTYTAPNAGAIIK